MPNTRNKTDKFFLYSAPKKGRDKGKALLVTNHVYNGDRSKLNLKDLIEFLKEKNIDPTTVALDKSYMAEVKIF